MSSGVVSFVTVSVGLILVGSLFELLVIVIVSMLFHIDRTV